MNLICAAKIAILVSILMMILCILDSDAQGARKRFHERKEKLKDRTTTQSPRNKDIAPTPRLDVNSECMLRAGEYCVARSCDSVEEVFFKEKSCNTARNNGTNIMEGYYGGPALCCMKTYVHNLYLQLEKHGNKTN